MKRFVFVSVTVLALASTAPAWAHEEINPSSVPTGKPVFFTLNAANEKNVDLTKITLTAPTGLPFGAATKDPAGWTSTKTDTAITWTGGAVKPDRFEQWGFEIEGADQPGTPSYKVTLGYADSSSDNVQVPITVHAATAADATGAAASTKSGGDGKATAAIALSVLALLGAIGAAVLARRGGAGAAPAGATATKAGGGQDW